MAISVLSIYNIKGGVGKTAAAVNLAFIAASKGKRVLVWDLDPQGATSFYFRVKPKVKGGGKKIVRGKSKISTLIKGTDYDNLDLLPSDFSYRDLDLRFSKEKDSCLKRLIAPLGKEYDMIVFDCPPSISELSEQVFRASSLLLVPLVPTTLSMRTFDQLKGFLKQEKVRNLQLRTFFSMVDRRKKLHREILENFSGKERLFLPAFIPYSSIIERMGQERRPVLDYAPRSMPATAFRNLWNCLDPLLK